MIGRTIQAEERNDTGGWVDDEQAGLAQVLFACASYGSKSVLARVRGREKERQKDGVSMCGSAFVHTNAVEFVPTRKREARPRGKLGGRRRECSP